jgi:hypothetical protein
MTIIHSPENTFRIAAIWAAISVDEGGMEGVCAVNLNGQWMPLIAADEAGWNAWSIRRAAWPGRPASASRSSR